MIIKILGMLLTLAASSGMGFCFAECLIGRERELKNLVDAIEMMKGELMYSASPVRDIVRTVTPRVKGECFRLFSVMTEKLASGCAPSQAWEYAVKETALSLSMKQKDAEYISELGFLMEAYELDEQQNHFEEMKSRISVLCHEASENVSKNAKLCKMSGIYGGALLCVLMF